MRLKSFLIPLVLIFLISCSSNQQIIRHPSSEGTETCSEILAAFTSNNTPSIGPIVSKNSSQYLTEATKHEIEIEGRKIEYTEVALPLSAKEAPSDKINWKSFNRDAYAEIFMKVIRPSILNNYKQQKFSLSELIKNEVENDLIIGLDVNHSYIILRDRKNGVVMRADGGAGTQYFVREGTDTVSSGIFFRFPEITDDQVEILKASLKDGNTFNSCTHAVCTSMSKVGIYFGGKEELPKTTTEAIVAALKGGILRENEAPMSIEIFTTSSKPFQKQLKDAMIVSKTNKDIIHKRMSGFLAIIHYGGKTVLKWVFLDLPKKLVNKAK